MGLQGDGGKIPSYFDLVARQIDRSGKRRGIKGREGVSVLTLNLGERRQTAEKRRGYIFGPAGATTGGEPETSHESLKLLQKACWGRDVDEPVLGWGTKRERNLRRLKSKCEIQEAGERREMGYTGKDTRK